MKNWWLALVLLAAFLDLGLVSSRGQEKKAEPREASWAYRPPVRPALPAVTDHGWVRSPIDAFILAKLEAAGLKPSPEASRVVLIRRVTYDLHGLPPTPADIDAFIHDPRPNAYELLVDRLLTSPRYGEHWASYWLDLVRYAESDGFKADDKRPLAFRYRDYVIAAFNNDKPYNRFIQEQLAGDELFPSNADALVATGYLRHYPDEYNAVNLELRRQEILNDITDTTSAALLGLTMGCARCHDHKFDPILQTDYYRLQAFFAAYQPTELPLADGSVAAERAQKQAEWERCTAEVRQKLEAIEKPHLAKAGSKRLARFPEEYQEAYLTPPKKRTQLQSQLAFMVCKQVDVNRDEMVKAMSPGVKTEWQTLTEQLKSFDALKPPPMPTAMAMSEIGVTAPPTFLLKRGDWRARGAEVAPGFPSAIDDREAPIPDQPKNAHTTGRRSILAAWLTQKENPLTARVMVNRLWHHHFGRGIVATPSDFGVQGDPPTHPELLDWLAVEFMDRGWSLKTVHRLIVSSSTYRQSSAAPDNTLAVDPQNSLFGRASRRRLEGESLRDALLAVSGRLSERLGGPSVFPRLPAETPASKTAWPNAADAREGDRRSVYIFAKRNLRFPLLHIFDVPDNNEPCARRHVSTNAPQALALLNSQLVLDLAKSFAQRVQGETGSDVDAAVDRAMNLALGRTPDAQERLALREFVIRASQGANVDRAIEDLCHALLNLNEFLYVD